MIGSIEEADGEAKLYEYRGKGASGDIVSKVKKHHAEETGSEYSDLTARKVASGGRRVRITYVVVVEVSVD